ncbi:hypothetical protein BS78_01G504900 [Paspalum vaginatum]|nr:hypothetical protein BS78_01G504900 [Paspalum vaginatum]
MAPPQRPVTLRDFLELGCGSSSDGFRSYPRRLAPPQPQPQPQPPARLVLVAEAADYHHHLLFRSPSRSPSSLFSLPRISGISRTFSRRIKEGFSWRRRFDDEACLEDEAYLDDRDSGGFPSPLVSSCSASDSGDSEEADDVTAEDSKPACECDDKASSSSSSSSADHEDCSTDAAHGGGADGNKMQAAAEGDDSAAVGRKLGMEDKQQLSPVSILDFPFDDDDGEEEGSDAGTCSPAFQRRPTPDLLHINRTKQQAQHKARRYHPEDLDARFVTAASESGESVSTSTRLATSSSSTTDSSSGATATTAPRHGDEEHQSVEHPSSPCQEEPQDPDDDDECRLLARLLQEGFAACLADDEVARALVLDFFEEALVRAAAEWLRGEGPRWGVADVVLSGKAALADMERGRRWMCVVGEEDRDVGEAVEGMLVDALVDEMVTELVPPCC